MVKGIKTLLCSTNSKSLIKIWFLFIVLASPLCLDFIGGSRWLVVGMDNGTVMVRITLPFCHDL